MRLASRCVGLALAALVGSDAHARTALLKTQAGSVVHWARAEVVVGIDAAAGSQNIERMDVVQAIQRAAHAWNRIPASQPHIRFTAEADRDVTIRFCRGKWQGNAIDLGNTKYDASPRDGSVLSAVIELNECDYKFTPPGESDTDPLDLQSVLTHEFGHVLGLGHSASANTVMFPSGKGVYVRLPTRDDQTALAVLYIGRDLQPSIYATALPAPGPLLPVTSPKTINLGETTQLPSLSKSRIPSYRR